MEAFVYCWTDILTNKLYVGWHKGLLSDGYVCSSKIMLEEYNKRPNDFKRQIIATGLAKDMIALESAILRAEKVATNEQYYNMHENNGLYRLGAHTEKTKKKISDANKGNKRPDLRLRNLLNNPMKDPVVAKKAGRLMEGSSNPMFNKKHSEDSKNKISVNRKGKGTLPKSEETKRKMAEARRLYWAKKRGEI
jgi:hypothetical protein